jgi:hypothetical protein
MANWGNKPNAFVLPLFLCSLCGPTRVHAPTAPLLRQRCAVCGGRLAGISWRGYRGEMNHEVHEVHEGDLKTINTVGLGERRMVRRLGGPLLLKGSVMLRVIGFAALVAAVSVVSMCARAGDYEPTPVSNDPYPGFVDGAVKDPFERTSDLPPAGGGTYPVVYVPEPSAAVVVAAAVLIGLVRRGRR